MRTDSSRWSRSPSRMSSRGGSVSPDRERRCSRSCLWSLSRCVHEDLQEEQSLIDFVCSDRILTFGIRSIRSPARVGIGYYDAVKLPARWLA